MAALTADRATPERKGDEFNRPVAATTTCYAGGIAVLNATGYSAPGSAATGLVADGVYQATVDNSTGADGAVNVLVRKGVFRFGNSAAADEITAAQIGDTCYIVDDQTVAKTDGTGTRSAAGKIVDLDTTGVWIEIK